MSYFEVVQTKSADSPSIDAFGRIRVSDLTTQIDVKQHTDNQPLLIDRKLNGFATNTYTSSESSSEFELNNTGDYAIAQTKTRGVYQSGKSQLIFITFANGGAQPNSEKQIGYFTADAGTYDTGYDGLFLSADDTTEYLNVYRAGTATFTPVERANWDDPMDGNGRSGINLDFTKAQILAIDFEWLGVGRVRFGFVVDGIFVVVHEFKNANVNSKVYMKSPNQPVRWQIKASGGSTSTLTYICASVNSEGSINEIGKVLGVNDNNVEFTCASILTRYAAIGLRLSDPRVFVKIIEFSLLSTTNDDFLWELQLNPVVNGSPTWIPVPDSKMEYALGTGAPNNITSNGTIIASGHGKGNQLQASGVESALRLGADIDGVADEIWLTIKPIGANAKFIRSIGWLEES
jgi:hypothetical protein